MLNEVCYTDPMEKSKRFGMVFTPYEQRLLKDMALSDGLSESEFVRWLIRDAAKERSMWHPPNGKTND